MKLTCKFLGGPADGLEFYIITPRGVRLNMVGDMELTSRDAPDAQPVVYAPEQRGRRVVYVPKET